MTCPLQIKAWATFYVFVYFLVFLTSKSCFINFNKLFCICLVTLSTPVIHYFSLLRHLSIKNDQVIWPVCFTTIITKHSITVGDDLSLAGVFIANGLQII